MREQLERRRDELTAELKAGQEMLAELDGKRLELQQTMLRISGALQVLGELLESTKSAGDPTPTGFDLRPGAIPDSLPESVLAAT
jgi:hypothetical protein